MYHQFDACNVQYEDEFKSMIKEDKYLDKTKKVSTPNQESLTYYMKRKFCMNNYLFDIEQYNELNIQ